MTKRVGILTAGGDSPGLNAAIRALGKCLNRNNYELWGFMDGFEGLAFDRCEKLDERKFSGILTSGGTILHTSRSKPNKMSFNGQMVDMTDEIVNNYHIHGLECLVCVGGGGTHKSALLLKEAGLNVLTMPKTIDNDLDMTDSSIGFDTALDVATSAIDALHSTASSHRRIMLLEVMGHNAGWLTLGSGIAGGADVILIPEIPYDIEVVAAALRQRTKEGKLFSIVPVAEGAMDWRRAEKIALLDKALIKTKDPEERRMRKKEERNLQEYCPNHIFELASQLENLTGLESRVTILGYLQRGGKPSCFDRLLASQLGSSCAQAILSGQYGVMVSFVGQSGCQLIPLEQVAGKRRVVNLDHPWMQTADNLGICFGRHVNN